MFVRKEAHEWRSAGMTETLRMRPVRMYASRKVIDPRVKKHAYVQQSFRASGRPRTRIILRAADLLCPSRTVEPGPGRPESLEPDFEWLFTCGDTVGEFRD